MRGSVRRSTDYRPIGRALGNRDLVRPIESQHSGLDTPRVTDLQRPALAIVRLVFKEGQS
jgi:hypothetical protein